MNDWREGVILQKLSEGCTMKEAATAAPMTRQGVWWRCGISPDFAQAVTLAREAGKDERTFRLWLPAPISGLSPSYGQGSRREATLQIRETIGSGLDAIA